MTEAERNALVEKYLPLVDVVIDKLMNSGQPPYIERADLWQCGALALVGALSKPRRRIAIKTLERIIRTGAVDEIMQERQHWPVERISMEDLLNEDGEPVV